MNTHSADLLRMVATLLVWSACLPTYADQQQTEPKEETACPQVGDAEIAAALVKIRKEHDLPALAAAIVTSKGLQRQAAVGYRKRDTDVAVTLEDKWHLGSCTKAMTAALVGKLVEEKKLGWDAGMADVFPELKDKFHTEFAKVTLRQLLSHRSGLQRDLNLLWYKGEKVKDLRYSAVQDYLKVSPQSKPESTFEYSNLGYIIAGGVIEKATGNRWEDEMSSKVFRPLKMESAGFGPFDFGEEVKQPWPHWQSGKPASTSNWDNPPVLGPAGRVHATMSDWAKFVVDQLRGAQALELDEDAAKPDDLLLQLETYQQIQTPPFKGDYALGWGVTQRKWGGRVLTHTGSNVLNFCVVWMSPEKDFAVLVCTNQGGDDAAKGTDAAAAALIKIHQSAE